MQAVSKDTAAAGTVGTVATVLGAVSNPLVLYSLFVLKTTGSGLPPGPFGLYGAAEGVGFLVVFGIVGWSLATKVKDHASESMEKETASSYDTAR